MRSWGMLIGSDHFGGKGGHVGALGWELRWVTRRSIIHIDLHKPNNKLINAQLEHLWCTDKPWANTDSQDSSRAGLGESYHLPLYSILCDLSRGLHPNVILSQDSQLGLPRFWRPITFCVDLQLKWGLKQSCSPHLELYNNMWHATCTQVNWGDYWLLMVGSQIGNLISDLFFGHNLFFSTQMDHVSPF
jgi:hypothetical protein